jgi:hypothetical protein
MRIENPRVITPSRAYEQGLPTANRASPPAAVLANPYAHAAQLHGPYTDHQSVATAKALDLAPDRRKQDLCRRAYQELHLTVRPEPR